MVTPIIDIISADTFSYEASPLVRGGFNWGLNFKWDAITREELKDASDFAKPVKSPTMAGGLFAMDRGYFKELGEYDQGEGGFSDFLFLLCFESAMPLPFAALGYGL